MPDGVWKYDWGQNRARGTLLLLLLLLLMLLVLLCMVTLC